MRHITPAHAVASIDGIALRMAELADALDANLERLTKAECDRLPAKPPRHGTLTRLGNIATLAKATRAISAEIRNNLTAYTTEAAK